MSNYFVTKSGSQVSYQPVDSKVVFQTITEKVFLTKAMQGPPGPPGSSSNASFEHPQVSASDTWTVNHNLGFRPAVSILSVGGREMWAEVIHTSVNQFIAYFDAPTSGIAICS